MVDAPRTWRPPTRLSQRLNVWMTPEQETALDDWRRRQRDIPTRAEAARRLIEMQLAIAEAVELDLDAWRLAQPDKPSRAEAAVILLQAALRAAKRLTR